MRSSSRAARRGGLGDLACALTGIWSKGMLCSSTEIGLPPGEDGLLILPEDSPIGRPVKELFESDVLLELEVTPNRPDLLSHRGMGRELATLLKTPFLPLEIPVRTTSAAPARMSAALTGAPCRAAP